MVGRRYFFELGGAMALYAGLLFASNAIDDAVHPQGAARTILAISPMIGAVIAAWAIMRQLWRMDELQRRIQLDAIAIAFMATALVTFTWGFAEAAGLPRLTAFLVWPIMAVFWIVGGFIARARYR